MVKWKGGWFVPAFPHQVAHSISGAPSRIRTSATPLPQPFYNLHLQGSLGTAENKGLTPARLLCKPFYHQHLQEPLATAHSKGFITSLESTLTENTPATPLECAVTKKVGEGVSEYTCARKFGHAHRC
jgi:hypothetical protein